MTNTKKALVSGRILKRSGLVVMRSGVATVNRSTRAQWEGSTIDALDSAARALIESSRDHTGTATYAPTGRLA